jgi:hypothetical protein
MMEAQQRMQSMGTVYERASKDTTRFSMAMPTYLLTYLLTHLQLFTYYTCTFTVIPFRPSERRAQALAASCCPSLSLPFRFAVVSLTELN